MCGSTVSGCTDFVTYKKTHTKFDGYGVTVSASTVEKLWCNIPSPHMPLTNTNCCLAGIAAPKFQPDTRSGFGLYYMNRKVEVS